MKHFGAEAIFRGSEEEKNRESHWKFLVPLFYRNHLEQSEILNNDIAIDKIPLKASLFQEHLLHVL